MQVIGRFNSLMTRRNVINFDSSPDPQMDEQMRHPLAYRYQSNRANKRKKKSSFCFIRADIPHCPSDRPSLMAITTTAPEKPDQESVICLKGGGGMPVFRHSSVVCLSSGVQKKAHLFLLSLSALSSENEGNNKTICFVFAFSCGMGFVSSQRKDIHA